MSLLPDRERRDMGGEIEAAAGGPRVEFPFLAEAFAGEVERALSSNDFSRITSSELERVITAAVKLYAAKAEAEETLAAPVSAEKATPTEVVVFVSEMLRAVNVSVFDLAMWYRRPR
jgi:hypothetical protein